ncbi:hypothetical protein ALI144C_10130 [Actinosynnema sp. ALI-1.44]|uniref:YncE family protein n=1 Tax=Actinosynnema sp. ALI-1.44 TaxID=1933779 RepID=UPI00097C4159|nr:hypothetical protein [Actinosynnema sp. ALI-1.44]ONI86989.1 hypothetical protein ALI144C_10130 [Actinosynnema sp. ALI-1.44]
MDDVHKQVFITGGPSSNSILVTNFSGQVTKTIDNQLGATGLELSADSTQLYVALASGDAIAVIDTTTLAETARHATGARTCPTHLARAGAYVWFGYGCEGTFTGKIGRYDPATGQPVGNLQGNARFQRAPLLTAATTATGPLVAGQLGLSSSTVQVYSLAGESLTAGATGDVVGASLTDLDITPDGTTLLSAAGSRDRVDAFAPADLAGRGAYSVRPRPNSVALNAGNTHIAAGAITGDSKDVLVYKLGASVPVRTIALGTGDVVAPRGLAWSAEGNRLFVVSHHDNDPEPELSVFTNATGT